MPCSKTCGGGIQTRNVICRRKEMNSWIFEDDSACVEPRPVEPVLERSCNEVMCPPEYLPLAWSKVAMSHFLIFEYSAGNKDPGALDFHSTYYVR
jgi:hypothetical protein